MSTRRLTDPTGFPARVLARTGRALVAAALGWATLFAWRDLVAEPHRLIQGALLGAILIAAVGGLLRARRTAWPFVLLAQSVVLVSWVQSRSNGRSGLGALIPTPDGVRRTVDVIVQGANDVNTYASPVSTKHPEAVEYLLVLGLVVILAIDLFGVGLRRSSWAGLPVVIALTVPVSVLDQGLSPVVFGACALLFVLLLAGDESERIRTWARRVGGGPGVTSSADEAHSAGPGITGARPGGLRATAAGIGTVAAVTAFVIPAFVPVGVGVDWDGFGSGSGANGRAPVKLTNPIVDLHRNLTQGGKTPLVTATTNDPEREYLRMTVLDVFDGARWKPSKRDLPEENKTNGSILPPPGMTAVSPGERIAWSLRITDDFETAWLPAPYPLARVSTEDSDWRYDARTLDFLRVDEETGEGVRYELTALHPRIDATDLESAGPPPPAVREALTLLPDGLPPALADIARRVTASATTDYGRAVLLQNWFRVDGDFEYSTEPDSGNSADALERFITTDRIGYCEQFAASMALMARTLGIPARVVIGFLRPDRLEDRTLIYTADGLHAWPELYFEGSGWVRFEPTPPGRSGNAPTWTRQQTVPTDIPTQAPTAQPVQPTARPTIERDPGGGTAHEAESSPPYAYLALGAAGLVLLVIPGLIRHRRRKQRLSFGEGVDREAAAAALWTELLSTAVDLGLDLPTHRSIRSVAETLTRRFGGTAEDRAALDELVLLLERARYGQPGPMPVDEHARMVAQVRRWSRLFTRTASARARVGAAVAPRSVLFRRSVRTPAVGAETSVRTEAAALVD